jgi:hypothetical protein
MVFVLGQAAGLPIWCRRSEVRRNKPGGELVLGRRRGRQSRGCQRHRHAWKIIYIMPVTLLICILYGVVKKNASLIDTIGIDGRQVV